MNIARPILGVLLLAMGVGQASNLPAFVDIMETYGLGGSATAVVLSIALLVVELLGGVGLLAHRRSAASVAVLVALAWTAIGLQAFARGLDVPNCGCFGTHLSQPLRWWVLVQDAEFVALAWWVHRRWTVPRQDARSGALIRSAQ